jgi:hypothetical protein
MLVKVIADHIITSHWLYPRIGQMREVDDRLGQHLVDVGMCTIVKVEGPAETKKDPDPPARSPLSVADRVSPEPIAPPSKPRKSKRSP